MDYDTRKQSIARMETDYSKHDALSMEDKMFTGAVRRAKNYGWDSSFNSNHNDYCDVLVAGTKCNTAVNSLLNLFDLHNKNSYLYLCIHLPILSVFTYFGKEYCLTVVTKLDTPKSGYREKIGTEWLVLGLGWVRVRVGFSVTPNPKTNHSIPVSSQ